MSLYPTCQIILCPPLLLEFVYFILLWGITSSVSTLFHWKVSLGSLSWTICLVKEERQICCQNAEAGLDLLCLLEVPRDKGKRISCDEDFFLQFFFLIEIWQQLVA